MLSLLLLRCGRTCVAQLRPFVKLHCNVSSTSASTMTAERLVWVDLEVSCEIVCGWNDHCHDIITEGLDVEKDHILEMACVITDGNLKIIEEAPDLIIHQSDEVLQGMPEWCVKQHGKSGLTQAVKESTISLADAEEQMLKFVQTHTPEGKCPLAGNSVHWDKKFLDKYMSRFMAHLHYRIVDVSTVKELCKRWYPDRTKIALKSGSHRANEDIHESIQELKYYREAIFKQ